MAATVRTAGWAADSDAEDRRIAGELAALLRAGRAVVSQSQDLINGPGKGPKGLDGATVLARAMAIYQSTAGTRSASGPASDRERRLLDDEMQAIREVIDANQGSINAPEAGFKGFIPAVFGRLVCESFSRRAKGEAEMKVTAPVDLVRNRKALPDSWEAGVINGKFLSPSWPKGQSYEAVVEQENHPVFRIAVPEYYGPTCLSCHGGPKGQLDVTGYPKEGASAGDLGGVISLSFTHP
jgi:hypothetical protein